MNRFARMLMPAAALAMVTSTGCGLICSDFEGDVRVDVSVSDPDSEYFSIETVDPNDYDEYADNRDRIENGEILGITVTFTSVPNTNAANYGIGQIDIRRADDPNADFVTAVGEWNGINIEVGNSFPVILAPDAKGQVDDILFGSNPGPVELRIAGIADQGPVEFTAEVEVQLGFSSCL